MSCWLSDRQKEFSSVGCSPWVGILSGLCTLKPLKTFTNLKKLTTKNKLFKNLVFPALLPSRRATRDERNAIPCYITFQFHTWKGRRFLFFPAPWRSQPVRTGMLAVRWLTFSLKLVVRQLIFPILRGRVYRYSLRVWWRNFRYVGVGVVTATWRRCSVGL